MLFEASGAKNYLSKIVYVKFSKKGGNHTLTELAALSISG